LLGRQKFTAETALKGNARFLEGNNIEVWRGAQKIGHKPKRKYVISLVISGVFLPTIPCPRFLPVGGTTTQMQR
jgi:hypothetical protein